MRRDVVVVGRSVVGDSALSVETIRCSSSSLRRGCEMATYTSGRSHSPTAFCKAVG